MGTSIEKHPIIIPGKYKGLMGGYYVEVIFHNGNKSHPIEMDVGVRSINSDVDVEVLEDGTVKVDI